MTVERDPRATTAQQCSKGLILLQKQTAYVSKALILHAHEIGTFCIDCTGTPIAVFPFGTFEESGDASPASVNRKVAVHFRRCALTRAKARALRDALGIDAVVLEELGEVDHA